MAGTRNPIKGVATAVLLESMRPAVCLDGIEIVWSGVAVGGKTRRKKKSDKGEKTQTGRITGAVNRIGCGAREIETEKKGLYRSVFCEDGCFDKPVEEEGSIGGGGEGVVCGRGGGDKLCLGFKRSVLRVDASYQQKAKRMAHFYWLICWAGPSVAPICPRLSTVSPLGASALSVCSAGRQEWLSPQFEDKPFRSPATPRGV